MHFKKQKKASQAMKAVIYKKAYSHIIYECKPFLAI